MKGGSIGREKALDGFGKHPTRNYLPQPSICDSFRSLPRTTSMGSRVQKQKSSDSFSTGLSDTLLYSRPPVKCQPIVSSLAYGSLLRIIHTIDPVGFQVLSFTEHQSLMFLKAFREERGCRGYPEHVMASNNIHSALHPIVCLVRPLVCRRNDKKEILQLVFLVKHELDVSTQPKVV